MEDKNVQSDQHLGVAHLIVLTAFTITAFILLAEIFIRGWDKLAVPFVIFPLFFSWYLNLMQKYTVVQRIWLYAVFMMFAFFFYGMHQTGFALLSVSIIIIILVFLISRIRGLIWTAVFSYFFTVFFNLAGTRDQWETIYEMLSFEIIFQGVLVLLAGWIANFLITQRNKELKRHEQELGEARMQEELSKEQIRILARELAKLGTDGHGEFLLMKNAIKKAGVEEQIPYDTSRLISVENTMAARIADLKDFSDMIYDKTGIHDEVYEILDLLEQAGPAKSAELHRGGPDLIIDVDPMVPKAMVGDREKITKIIRHLVSNALRYTEKGGILVRILTHSYGDELNLCIEVRDTGMGIEKNELERLVRQLHERKTVEYRPGGLGMGLYLVSGFVMSMGGVFKIESEWGKGTTVSVSIPQRVSDAVPCMSYDQKSGVCVVYEDVKYPDEVVNAFYEDFFRNLSEKLRIPSYAVKNKEELQALIDTYSKVCLFTEQALYEANPAYYEDLKEVYTVVLTKGDLVLPEGSAVQIRQKPVSTPEILYVTGLAAKSVKRRRKTDKNGKARRDAALQLENLSERRIRQTACRKVMIVTDSMSDLPVAVSEERGIPVIPFRINTEYAVFLDETEIAQEGALRHLESYPGISSSAPGEEDFRSFFENHLRFAEHIIYISTSKRISASYDRAKKAAEKTGNVSVVDSGQVSGGVAILSMLADEQARAGKNADEILEYIKAVRPGIKTSFLIDNLDHLADVGRVSKAVARIAGSLMLHPVMVMKRGLLKPGGLYLGSMMNASEAYKRKILKQAGRIDKSHMMISMIGMNSSFLKQVKQLIRSEEFFDTAISRHACASVSINCGTDTFGIIYVEK